MPETVCDDKRRTIELDDVLAAAGWSG